MPAKGGGAYSDRRMADVEIVDYARPGFAVVWLDGPVEPASSARLAIRANEFETRLEPAWVALATGGTVDLTNLTREPHTVSCPSLGIVRRIDPGQVLAVKVPETGGHPLFLLDRPQIEGGVFAAGGPFTVLTTSSHYELRDLAPGASRLHVWHPRLPPVDRHVDVVADQVLELDLEMGVGHGAEEVSR